MRRYLPFLFLSFAASIVWISWCLPDMNEQGTFFEMLEWVLFQAGIQVFLFALLAVWHRAALWAIVLYGGFLVLHAAGLLGWALSGEATPLSVYSVAVLHFINGFALLFHSLNDLKIIPSRIYQYDFENE